MTYDIEIHIGEKLHKHHRPLKAPGNIYTKKGWVSLSWVGEIYERTMKYTIEITTGDVST